MIGPNGAGKTTLMDVITGKTRPQSGKAIYDQSVDLTTLEPVAIARQGIGRKFQKPTVFEALTVAENLALAMKGDKSVWASLRARLSSEQDDRLNEVLRLLRLDGERYRRRGCFPMARNSSLRSACCWCRSRICCCLMSQRPA